MIDTSQYSNEQSEVFDDIMDQLTPSQRNRILSVTVDEDGQVLETTQMATIPRPPMTPLRFFIGAPVVLCLSGAGFVCMLLGIALCVSLIFLPIGIPMVLGASGLLWAPWQKWIWGTTGNIWHVRTTEKGTN